ncbi:MAG: 4Fe-4S dicluster domain-containing protein [Deltaproteobacteria bacterium]|nr:4Fe-4S dicluster domain-containing protein [Deltaproteobacteria bacterium]
MGLDRREFLKIAGLTAAISLGGKTVFELLAPGEVDASIKGQPLTRAKRWGMVIDMKKMTDEIMDQCSKACHKIHNVPDWGDPRVEIKWIWKEVYEHSFPGQGHDYQSEELTVRNLPLLCNHCDNPPCCRVCPTKATWKRESDGIVIVDPHRCIGCRFCMAGCPYGARSFNWGDPRKAPEKLNPGFPSNPDYPTRTKGVVEKCNFCAERIADGLYPACVEAANELEAGSMIFGDLEDYGSDVRKALRSRYAIRRKPELGTGPNIYYLV